MGKDACQVHGKKYCGPLGSFLSSREFLMHFGEDLFLGFLDLEAPLLCFFLLWLNSESESVAVPTLSSLLVGVLV